MIENYRKIITKVENRINSLSTIYLTHKQVGGGRLSRSTIHRLFMSKLYIKGVHPRTFEKQDFQKAVGPKGPPSGPTFWLG